MKLIDASKRLLTDMKIKSQAAVSCIRSEFEPDDSEALRNIAAYSVVLRICVAQFRCSLV